MIPKPGKPPGKPANLRPLGILRPDAKGFLGFLDLRNLLQFAYLPGMGLSDALQRVVQHLREARQLIEQAKPSPHEQKQGIQPPALVGGVTFALDVSQAFDTVSFQEIIQLLQEQGADSDTVRLVHARHDKSCYKFQSH